MTYQKNNKTLLTENVSFRYLWHLYSDFTDYLFYIYILSLPEEYNPGNRKGSGEYVCFR